jgi:hemolysin-activating ACP:hemolysin acyltransferase
MHKAGPARRTQMQDRAQAELGAVAAAPAQGDLLSVRLRSPHLALSVMVQLSANAPAFAQVRFGAWAKVLMGQVNRGDYVILLDRGRPVGFAGWFPAFMAEAEAWLAQDRDVAACPPGQGDCAVMNAFMAPSPEAARYLRESFLRQIPNLKWVYAKRVKGGKPRLARVPNPRCTRTDL